MDSWLLRGIIMSVINIAARILLGFAVIAWPIQSPIYRAIAIAAIVLIAVIWGGYDGIKDARAHPDPDDYDDLTMRWLKAGFLAGWTSCLICWILGTYWLDGIGQASFWIEMIAGTSFITLLVYVPAFFGVSVGRFLVRREQRKGEDTDWSHHELHTQPTEVVQTGA
ncbi:B-4DMT family transporter [Gordonia sp. (in: high G+C Gram-positive bacteria)]|uniref:B-4DMT family transporter n=1 Tax=Gordonia sp. (in: high G+C Gram-positive bacteria) TaxID=84139 RepID=UPI0026080AD1|nr:B-4DMT family transporter [Gordonia sp. (in: high G+C Gram-positive bacteria)]